MQIPTEDSNEDGRRQARIKIVHGRDINFEMIILDL